MKKTLTSIEKSARSHSRKATESTSQFCVYVPAETKNLDPKLTAAHLKESPRRLGVVVIPASGHGRHRQEILKHNCLTEDSSMSPKRKRKPAFPGLLWVTMQRVC